MREDLSSSLRRIRRGAAPPSVALEELGQRHRQRVALEIGGEEADLSWRLTRWVQLDEAEEYETRYRELHALLRKNGVLIGYLHFREVDLGSDDNDAFREAMDMGSSATYELGEVLASEWRDIAFEVSSYGSVVELSMLWMSPGRQTEIWTRAVDTILGRRFFAGRSILVLKAFPLEYNGKVTQQNIRSKQRRTLAMTRLYNKCLDMAPLPGRPGKEGWMWAPSPRLKKVIRPPRFRATKPLWLIWSES